MKTGRAAQYDFSRQITESRLPVATDKGFGMLSESKNEPQDGYVKPADRAAFAPRQKIISGKAHLYWDDGRPVNVKNATYVVVPDPSTPTGETLLIDPKNDQKFHSDLANGGEVKYAGKLTTNAAGRIPSTGTHHINNATGHYKLPDPVVSKMFIRNDLHISEGERQEQLAKLAEHGPAFSQMRNDKLSPFIDRMAPPARPSTPPIELLSLDES